MAYGLQHPSVEPIESIPGHDQMETRLLPAWSFYSVGLHLSYAWHRQSHDERCVKGEIFEQRLVVVMGLPSALVDAVRSQPGMCIASKFSPRTVNCFTLEGNAVEVPIILELVTFPLVL